MSDGRHVLFLDDIHIPVIDVFSAREQHSDVISDEAPFPETEVKVKPIEIHRGGRSRSS